MKWKRLRDIDSVGWIFWMVTFAVLAYPGYYLAREATYDTATIPTRVGFGLFIAAVGAGVISWGVNHLLHLRNMRRITQRKKEEKRQKRRKPGRK